MSRLVRSSARPAARELPGVRAQRLLDQSLAPTLHGLTMSLVEFSPSDDNDGQRHPEQEAFFFLEGDATAQVGSPDNPQTIEVAAGDFLYVESGEFHRIRSNGPGWARALVVKTGRGL